MAKFKLGDIVLVTGTIFDLKNEQGKIVARDGREYLIKCNRDIGSYHQDSFTNFTSDKNDLVYASVEKIKLK